LLMKVFLPDGTQRIVEIESSAANMTEVWSQMCEKLSLPRREWPFFFVWLFGGISADIMETRKTIKQIVAEYPELRQQQELPMGLAKDSASAFKPQKGHARTLSRQNSGTFTSQRITHLRTFQPGAGKSAAEVESRSAPLNAESLESCVRFVFRQTQILMLEEELSIESAWGIRLLYLDAVRNVHCGNHPMRGLDCVDLAAFQLQEEFGDYDSGRFAKGWLLEDGGKTFKKYVPEHVKSMASKGDWEHRIVVAYKKLTGMAPREAQLKYLDIVRLLPSYGSTFFKAENEPDATTTRRQWFDGNIIVGVNSLGIHLIDPEMVHKTKVSPIFTIFLTWLISWDSDQGLFFAEYEGLNPGDATRSLTLRTPEAHMINDVLCDWLDKYKEVGEGQGPIPINSYPVPV